MTTRLTTDRGPAMLVAERGLRNNRRNRRWLALVRMLAERIPGGDQGVCEDLAWSVIQTWEGTR